MFCKKGVLKVFVKFTEKELRVSIFLVKITTSKIETLAQCFTCEFCQFFKNTFFSRTSTHENL